jgi:acyl-coenzyme A synthetase/AMP-(fatty) acid ligase
MLSHQAVLNFVNWASDEFAIRADDRLSNHAPLNFDLSTFDIYAALGAGASVTVIPEGLAMFPSRLAELIERHRISVWYSVPSVLTLLASKGGLAERDTSAIRTVLFAGEVFPVRHLREVMHAIPSARFFNLYGPTETNVCTFHEVEQPPGPDDPPLPIGRPCSNMRTIVLDANGRPVTQPGAEGLLHVAGSSLMDGYYGRPAETAAAFGTNSLTPGREEPIYCTGDWVSIGDEGEYLFLGRRDHMVKVGGHRVELGELETALYAHPGVREAAAVAVPDDLLGNRLRAVVVAGEAGLDEQELKRHCGTVLPGYMVPHEIRFLEALPRTSTDKVDRPSLARHDSEPG